MALLLQSYNIPVVYNDLNQTETLNDVFYALENLSSTINSIFNKIDCRIVNERIRLDHIKVRISTCRAKVDLVRGSQNATTVFSTSKFPAPKTLPSYPTLFSDINENYSPYREVDEEVQYTCANPGFSMVGDINLNSELNTIISRLNIFGTEMERVEFIMEDCGLGKLPDTIPSVGSMLLFNSIINPYKDYQTLDNLLSASRGKAIEEDIGKVLASAPTTILSGDALPDIQALDLLYKPSMGEMLNLALPENLPLDFIANIQYSGIDLPSIAPSAARRGKADYSLPQITDGGMLSSSSSAYSPPPSAKTPVSIQATTTTTSNNSLPPPPPPPPPPVAPHIVSSAPIISAPILVSQPPPPPPMMAANKTVPPIISPPLRPQHTNESHSYEEEEEEEYTAAQTGGQGSFLDAIKSMSVSKLRSKEESAIAAQKVQKKVDLQKPLTMAEALKERLARRNEAISGKVDKEKQKRDSLIIQAARQPSILSIPPPAQLPPASHQNIKKDLSAKPTLLPPVVVAVTVDSDSDTGSDTLSEFSDESTRKPMTKKNAVVIPTTTTTNTFAPPQIVAPINPSPPAPINPSPPAPLMRRGSGLMDQSNTALTNMLSIAARNQNRDSDDSEDDDDEWDH